MGGVAEVVFANDTVNVATTLGRPVALNHPYATDTFRGE
jgi:hypothetical protein